MTYAFKPPAIQQASLVAIVRDVARCWRRARDENHSVIPCLTEALRRYRSEMLAPAFASLLALYEAAFGRRLSVGTGPDLAEDEMRLAGWLQDGVVIRDIAIRSEMSGLFDCAIRSTRIMMSTTEI